MDIHENIDSLSPTSKDQLSLLVQSIKTQKAILGQDKEGRPTIQYSDPKKLLWDVSNANLVAIPKDEADIQQKTKALLDFISYIKTEKPPSGIILDRTKVTSNAGKYREGKEFFNLQKVLGSGNSAGDIVVVKDKGTGSEHAQKTVMISVFRREEIKAWIDLSGEDNFPCLYHFQLRDNKMVMHMEVLHDAISLKDVIDTHMAKLYKISPELVKPFSFYVFHGILSAVETMNKYNWAHRDLHSGNVMIQRDTDCNLQVRVIDFGSANRLESELGLDVHGFRSDVAQAVRLFSALYMGQEFESTLDLRKNSREKLGQIADCKQMNDEDRTELFCVIDSALNILTPKDVHTVTQDLKHKLKQETDPEIDEVMKKVAAILFFDKDFQPIHETDGSEPIDAPDSVAGIGSSGHHEVPEDFLQKLRSSMSIRCHSI